MAKNIVVFSDGTGQEGGKGPNTNVYKLFNMIEDRTTKQISFYDQGLGTDWRKISGNLFGAGIKKNIIECYRFIFDNYQDGDKIFLFGFSRGATTIRSLSYFIHLFGMLPKSRPELIKQAYSIYEIKDKITKIGGKIVRDDSRRKSAARQFVDANHNMWCRIHFLGAWDTVMALGTPWNISNVTIGRFRSTSKHYHNLTLSESVVNARHALAIDDERKNFLPALWDNNIMDHQSLKQVWFAGMHTDIGGGYAVSQLSDIPLIWMTEEAKTCGLLIYKDHKILLNPDASGLMHDSRGKGWAKLYPRQVRSLDPVQFGIPVVHESVTKRVAAYDHYNPWIMNHNPGVAAWPVHMQGNNIKINP